MKKVGIIGGGASGLLSGIVAAMQGAKVTVFESRERFGTKLSITGNGKCNLTNENIFPVEKYYYAKDYDFVERVLRSFSPEAALSFFHGLGIETTIRRDGYIYPKSNSAKSVTAALTAIAADCKVTLKTNCPITDIEKTEQGYRLTSGEWKTECDRVIFACGSDAGMKNCTDNPNLIRKLNHKVNPMFPALTSLKFKNKKTEVLAKTRMDAMLHLFIDSKKLRSDYGEVQFNKGSISGIPVFQLSHQAVLGIEHKQKVLLRLDFYPEEETEQLCNRFEKEARVFSKLSFEEFLITKMPKSMIRYLCKELGIQSDLALSKFDTNIFREVCGLLKSFEIQIDDYSSYETAQVVQGGVDVSQINPSSMESERTKGLYFCGEILDVDGYCGGYNLQWAWSTAYIAGMHAANATE